MQLRIQSLRAATLRIPLNAPIILGGGTRIVEREYLLVLLTTDNGLTGVGWSYTHRGDLAGIVRRNLHPVLDGADPMDNERLWQQMYRSTRYIGRSGMVMRAISAVDIALWDLKGKISGVPLYKLLGGYREQVPVVMAGMYYTEGRTPADDAREATAYVEQGYRTIKLMGGAAPFAEDLARLRAVRQAVGPHVGIAVDVNAVWHDAKVAADYTRRLAELDIAFVEEPCLSEDLPTLRALTAASPVPIGVGEVESGVGAFRELANAGVHILRPDATAVGGITEWLKVHGLATALSRPILPHDFPYVHVHLAAALPGVQGVEFVTTAGGISNFHYILREPLEATSGLVSPPSAPGLGLDLDWEAIERYAMP